MKLPKVLIFTITYEGKDYALEEFMEHCSKINYPNYRHIFIDNSNNPHYVDRLREKGLEAYHTERGNNSREALARSQNVARRIALNEGYDYILSIESDIMCPPDVVERLLKHAKPVVTGFYYIGDREKGQRVPCITILKWNEELGAYGTRLLFIDEWEDYTNKGLKKVAAGGMGVCLIKRNVFEKFAFTYDTRLKGHSDIYFFNECFRQKIPVYVDTDLYCEHKNSKWTDVKDR